MKDWKKKLTITEEFYYSFKNGVLRAKLMQEAPQILMALCNQPLVPVYLIRNVHRWKATAFSRLEMFA